MNNANITLRIITPAEACPVRMVVPAISPDETIIYALEELCRVQSFERRHGMTMREALGVAQSPVGVDAGCVANEAVRKGR